MKVEFGVSFDRASFTTAGPTPRLAAWIGAGPTFSARYSRRGFEFLFGLRPLRIGWKGVWIYLRKKREPRQAKPEERSDDALSPSTSAPKKGPE